MTERLFDTDSYIKSFTATVTDCFPKDNGFCVVLNKTAFFPEGGGQYGDRGTLNGENVLDTVVLNDQICHYVKTPFKVGENVSGEIDWAERFNNMQNHSGEHVVSGIVNSLFGLNNVGFHIGTDFVTIDYDGVLTREQINLIEEKANSVVAENLPITAYYPKKEELKELNYRSKKSLDGDIRIVTVKGIDVCACCAPHVRSTAEIGIIKLLDCKHYKKGVRLNMLCGLRALKDFQIRFSNTAEISNTLSCKQYECASAVNLLLSEVDNLKEQISVLSKSLAENMANSIAKTEGDIIKFCRLSGESLRIFADLGKEKCSGLFIALNGNDQNGYKYVICGNSENFSEKIKELNTALNGKGGGKPPLAQGLFNASEEEIKKYFKL